MLIVQIWAWLKMSHLEMVDLQSTKLDAITTL